MHSLKLCTVVFVEAVRVVHCSKGIQRSSLMRVWTLFLRMDAVVFPHKKAIMELKSHPRTIVARPKAKAKPRPADRELSRYDEYMDHVRGLASKTRAWRCGSSVGY